MIFSTNEVGEYLTVAIIGYESDGGAFEQLAYEAMGMAVDSYTGGASTLLATYDISLAQIIGSILGEEDDWLGSYENTWYCNDGWGIGRHGEIVLQDERGVDCLRLWFIIE